MFSNLFPVYTLCAKGTVQRTWAVTGELHLICFYLMSLFHFTFAKGVSTDVKQVLCSASQRPSYHL